MRIFNTQIVETNPKAKKLIPPTKLLHPERNLATVAGVLAKGKRFQLFLDRLRSAPPASTADAAFNLLTQTLNAVEDEFSGVPNRPENWRTDGRMYPPQADSLIKNLSNPEVRKYRSKGHYTYIAENGSLRIETLDAEVLIDKPGQVGRAIDEPPKPKRSS